MSRIINWARERGKSQHIYFTEYKGEIAIRNLQLIRIVSTVMPIIYALYYAVTMLFFKEHAISLRYAWIIPVMFIFLVFSAKSLSSNKINIYITMMMTYLLYLACMAFVIIMSVFPHPEVPSVYYPLFLLMAPVMFILPVHIHLVSTFFSLLTFFILVTAFKSPDCWSHELFEAVTAAVFACVVCLFMTHFRFHMNKSTAKYYRLSRVDGLTGLLNRATGIEAAKAYISASGKEKFALCFFDIDRFKNINDTYGHIEGDKVLKNIASTATVVFGRNDIVCRYGGDEFLVFIKDVRREQDVVESVDRFIKSVASLGGCYSCNLTCSVGICFGFQNESVFEDILKKSDSALYKAKIDGKNQLHIYDEILTNQV